MFLLTGLFCGKIQSASDNITVISAKSTWQYNSKPSDLQSEDFSVEIIPINSSYSQLSQDTTKDRGSHTFKTRLPKRSGSSRSGAHSKKQSKSTSTSPQSQSNATFARKPPLPTMSQQPTQCELVYGLPIQVVFFTCGLTGIFVAATVSLIVVIFCCNPNKHSKDRFFNQNSQTAVHENNISYNNAISNNSATNTMKLQYLTPATTHDLFQQLQALQIIIQQQIANNTQNQYSINDSYQNSGEEYANNQRRMSVNSVNSPWNSKIQHQLNTFQTSNNSNINMSNASNQNLNHDTDIILTGQGHNAKQHTTVQVDTMQFMEFLDYQRRKSLQQSHVQGQHVHYQSYVM